MDTKSTVVKSKSSNGRVINKREKQKSTKSDAEFQPLSMKKRGVYVENKDNKLIDIYENNDTETKKKPPPRPRPGQKRFLSSVLTILSKSTTGTQYPDPDLKTKKKTINRLQQRRSHDTEVLDDNFIEARIKTKKPKYKSKILNGDNYPMTDKLVVLQSKKDIIHTPSNFSENTPMTESTIPMCEILEKNIYSGVAEGLAKEILEGRSEKTVRNHEDPSTLVSDPSKDEKKLYSFFVDLLETTFDVYNVETDQTKSKETILEIEETVAKKLNFQNDPPTHEKEEIHDLNFKIQEDKLSNPDYTIYKPMTKRRIPKRTVFSRSFIYPKPVSKPTSAVKKKPQTKKSKRNELLKTIKEELKMDFMTFEEPQNLFQALRNMAKYKKKCQQKKTIQFEENYDDPLKNCRLGRDLFEDRKVRKHKNRKEKMVFEKPSLVVAKSNKVKSNPYPVNNTSNHSLKVYGIEYENNFDEGKCYSSSLNFSEVDFNGAFGISDSSLDVNEFYSLLQE